jgi:HAMP domain-containing protein
MCKCHLDGVKAFLWFREAQCSSPLEEEATQMDKTMMRGRVDKTDEEIKEVNKKMASGL